MSRTSRCIWRGRLAALDDAAAGDEHGRRAGGGRLLGDRRGPQRVEAMSTASGTLGQGREVGKHGWSQARRTSG